MDKRCGTCKYFFFGMLSECGWRPQGDVPSWFHSHAMWIDDGKDCKVWEEKVVKSHLKKKMVNAS